MDLIGLAEIGINAALWLPGSGALLADTMTWMKDNYENYIQPTIDRAKGIRPQLIKVKRSPFQQSQLDEINELKAKNAKIGDWAKFEFDNVQIIDFKGINKAIEEIDAKRRARIANDYNLDGMSVESMQAIINEAKEEEINGEKSKQKIKNEQLEKEIATIRLQLKGLDKEYVDEIIEAKIKAAKAEREKAETEKIDPETYRIELIVPKNKAMGQIDFGDWKKQGFIVKIFNKATNEEIIEGKTIQVKKGKKIVNDIEVDNYETIDVYAAIFETIQKVPLTLGQNQVSILPDQIIADVTDEALSFDFLNGANNLFENAKVFLGVMNEEDRKFKYGKVDPIAGHQQLRTEKFANGMFNLVTKLPKEEGAAMLERYYSIVEQGVLNDANILKKEKEKREEQISSLKAAKKKLHKWLIISSLLLAATAVLCIAITVAAIIFFPPLGYSMLGAAITTITSFVLRPLKHLKFLGLIGIGLGAIKVTIECQNQLIKTTQKKLAVAIKGQELVSELYKEISTRKHDVKNALEQVNALKEKSKNNEKDEIIKLQPKSGDAGINIICQSLEESSQQQNWHSLSLQLTDSDITCSDGLSRLVNLIIMKPSSIKELNLTGSKINEEKKGEGALLIISALEKNITLTKVEFDSSKENETVIKQLAINQYIQDSFDPQVDTKKLCQAFACKENSLVLIIKEQATKKVLDNLCSMGESLEVIPELKHIIKQNEYLAKSIEFTSSDPKTQALSSIDNLINSCSQALDDPRASLDRCNVFIQKNAQYFSNILGQFKTEIKSEDIIKLSNLDSVVCKTLLATYFKNESTEIIVMLNQVKNDKNNAIVAAMVFKKLPNLSFKAAVEEVCVEIAINSNEGYCKPLVKRTMLEFLDLFLPDDLKKKPEDLKKYQLDRLIKNFPTITLGKRQAFIDIIDILILTPKDKQVSLIQGSEENFSNMFEQLKNNIDEKYILELIKLDSDVYQILLATYFKDKEIIKKIVAMLEQIKKESEENKANNEAINVAKIFNKLNQLKKSKNAFTVALEAVYIASYDDKLNYKTKKESLEFLDLFFTDKEQLKLKKYQLDRLIVDFSKTTPSEQEALKDIKDLIIACEELGAKDIPSKENQKIIIDIIKTYLTNGKNEIEQEDLLVLLKKCSISDLKELQEELKEPENELIDEIIQANLQENLLFDLGALTKEKGLFFRKKNLLDELKKKLNKNYDLTKFDCKIEDPDIINYINFICKRNLMRKYILSNDLGKFIANYKAINTREDRKQFLSDIGLENPYLLKIVIKNIVANEALKDNVISAEQRVELLMQIRELQQKL